MGDIRGFFKPKEPKELKGGDPTSTPLSLPRKDIRTSSRKTGESDKDAKETSEAIWTQTNSSVSATLDSETSSLGKNENEENEKGEEKAEEAQEGDATVEENVSGDIVESKRANLDGIKEMKSINTKEPKLKRKRRAVIDDDDDDDDDEDESKDVAEEARSSTDFSSNDKSSNEELASSDSQESSITPLSKQRKTEPTRKSKPKAKTPSSSFFPSAKAASKNKKTIEDDEAEEAKVEADELKEDKEEEEEDEDEEEEEDDDDDEEDEECEENGIKLSKLSTSSSATGETAAPLSKSSSSSLNALPSKFDPLENADWKQGEPVPYLSFVKALKEVESTSKRLRIQEIVSQFFRRVIALSPNDLLPSLYLFCNQLAPAYEGIEIGIGDSLLIKTIADIKGVRTSTIDSLYSQKGDLGLVVSQDRKQTAIFGYKPKKLSVRDVHSGMLAIAKSDGNKSQGEKIKKIKKLLVSCSSDESKYLVRELQGKLRIGLAEQGVLTALAHAVTLTPPSLEPGKLPEVLDASQAMSNEALLNRLDSTADLLKQVYSECTCYDDMVSALLEHGVERLHEFCHVRAGIPLKPMLAKPTKGVSEVLERFSGTTFTCEYKYDGERGQIHQSEDGCIRIFSRNCKEDTTKYPDVIEAMSVATTDKVTSFIIDSEVVAYDNESKKLLPFQVLSTRSRKLVSAKDVKVPVIICAFDLVYLNGQSLLQHTLAERRRLLKEHFQEVQDKFTFANSVDANDPEVLGSFLQTAMNQNCEGLVVKTLTENATYEPSKRSLNWLKLKKDYMDGLADSMDLVPIGAYYGRGKRTGVFGAYLLAAYDDEEEEYQSICKIGTGFSDVGLGQHNEFFKDKVLASKPRNYHTDMECDVWFEACQVWEVRAADLSISPIHKAAINKVKPGKGIALRFPRFLRIREDKNPEQATNASQVRDFYQAQNLATRSGQDDDEDDF